MTRLLTFSLGDDRPHCGVAGPDGVVDLTERMPGITDVGSLLAADRLAEAAAHAGDTADHRLDEIVFERLVSRPAKIFCIGVNYGGRAGEYADTTDASYPSVFVRFAESLIGHQQPLLRPPESHQLDYEGEIVAVIGRAGRRIPESAARTHVAGLTLGNEGTIRDWVGHAKFNVTQGKNWAASGSLGPWLVPIDEIDDLDDLDLVTRVNGEVRQHDSTARMKYPIAYQIHYLSTFTTLLPGDVVFTGTPTGAGARMDPPRWLAPGDVVEVESSAIGTLRNPVADEAVAFVGGTAPVGPEPR